MRSSELERSVPKSFNKFAANILMKGVVVGKIESFIDLVEQLLFNDHQLSVLFNLNNAVKSALLMQVLQLSNILQLNQLNVRLGYRLLLDLPLEDALHSL